MCVIGVNDLCKYMNRYSQYGKENSHRNRKKYIDMCLASKGLLDFVSGCEMIDYNEIIQSDHRGHVFDIEIVSCMNILPRNRSERGIKKLDSRRKTHRNRFY